MVRVAVVGGGAFGTEHLHAYRHIPDAEVVGMVEPDPSRRSWLAGEYGDNLTLFESVDSLLEHASPQAASVVVPSRKHRPVAEQLMQAGVDVLVEKPFAHSVDDALAIAETADRLDRLCLPGHVLRFSAAHRALQSEITLGVLGDIRLLALRRDRSRALAALFPNEHPASLTGVHDVDLAIWLTGQRVEQVRAVEHRVLAPTVDQFAAELRHVGGAVSFVSGAYLLPLERTGLALDRVEAVGTLGSRLLDDVIDDRPDGASGDRGTRNQPLLAELSHFVELVASGERSVVCTPADGVHAVQVVDAVIASAAGGGTPVDVGQAK